MARAQLGVGGARGDRVAQEGNCLVAPAVRCEAGCYEPSDDRDLPALLPQKILGILQSRVDTVEPEGDNRAPPAQVARPCRQGFDVGQHDIGVPEALLVDRTIEVRERALETF